MMGMVLLNVRLIVAGMVSVSFKATTDSNPTINLIRFGMPIVMSTALEMLKTP